MDWRFGQAGCTKRACVLFIGKRPRAGAAPGRVHEMQPGPAIGAKIRAVGGNCAARRTSFGQRKIQRRFDDLVKRQHRPLVCDGFNLHKTEMEARDRPPEIFDRQRRRALRERAIRRNGDGFLWRYIAEELAERLTLVTRQFENALIIGPMASHSAEIMAARQSNLSFACLSAAEHGDAVITEEDRLPFVPHSFDLVVAAGTLDSVNDLPGALVQIRRCLKPDGLFLGHMFGAGSLATLKSLIMAAEEDVATAHIHPQIDLRSAADLLSRAGFALPVADTDIARVRYSEWRSIVADIRDAGIGNALNGPRRYLGKRMMSRVDAEWNARADGFGKLEEQFTHLFLSGWAPSPSQQRPAQRGSASVSLASVLPSSEKH